MYVVSKERVYVQSNGKETMMMHNFIHNLVICNKLTPTPMLPTKERCKLRNIGKRVAIVDLFLTMNIIMRYSSHSRALA